MRTFKIASPAYSSNGKHGVYYSIAFTNDNGDVIKGFGDHISENSHDVKNVFEAEGTAFTDADRLISIEEIKVDEAEFDAFVKSYRGYKEERAKLDKEMEKRFTPSVFEYLYRGDKATEEERVKEYNEFTSQYGLLKNVDYYGFLKLIK